LKYRTVRGPIRRKGGAGARSGRGPVILAWRKKDLDIPMYSAASFSLNALFLSSMTKPLGAFWHVEMQVEGRNFGQERKLIGIIKRLTTP
jgi:hypothetical protein